MRIFSIILAGMLAMIPAIASASIQLSADGESYDLGSKRKCLEALARQYATEQRMQFAAEKNTELKFDGKELTYQRWVGYETKGYSGRCEGRRLKTFNSHVISEPPPSPPL